MRKKKDLRIFKRRRRYGNGRGYFDNCGSGGISYPFQITDYNYCTVVVR